jgi:hypothetical protein
MTVNPNNAVYAKLVNESEEVDATNPLPVAIISGGGGGGSGGTEYTEDAVAPANPVGGVVMAVRRDTLTDTEVSTDGDVVAIKATAKGQLHVFSEVTSTAGLTDTELRATPVPVSGTITLGTGTAQVGKIKITKNDGTVVDPVSPGSAAMAASVPVTLATDDALQNLVASEYETVAASATAQTLGATGATGDFIAGLLVIPATTSPQNVILLDNATSITVFTGGASSVSNLIPFFIPLGIKSVSGAWKVTTGTNVSVIAIGNFT